MKKQAQNIIYLGQTIVLLLKTNLNLSLASYAWPLSRHANKVYVS